MRPKLLLLLIYAILVCQASAFLRCKEQRPVQSIQSRSGTHPQLGMMEDITAVHSALHDLNPEVRVEMMTDVSHVALDLTAFFTPSRLHILSFAILGRILVLYTDCCVPGHSSVPPEELAVQAFLLATNLKDLVKAIAESR
ncbi:unnamed protein product [Cylindrotheca closterium]|uniref:Uncharacterized protein n=1 Tax=Cylindrotheca closterium TaxID=2856 RepID=A0AAD2FCK1_9STRA|nr:unnamed protein product [Cylindrotheca closterium]